MRKRLTEKAIEALRPDKITEIYDEVAKGLVLKISPAGARTWYFLWTENSRRRRSPALGSHPTHSRGGAMGLADARARANEMLGLLGHGKSPLDALNDADPAPRHSREEFTVADLVEIYLRDHAAKKKSGHHDARMLRRDVLPAIGNLEAKAIKNHQIYDLVLRPAMDRDSPHMADAIRRCLSKVFNFAIHDLSIQRLGPWREIEFNPMASFRQLAPKTPRQRALDDNEIHELWQVWEAELVQAEAFHGLARARSTTDASPARWADIDLENGTWFGDALPRELVATLKDHQERVLAARYVFPASHDPDRRMHPVEFSLSAAVLQLLLLQGQRETETLRMQWALIDLGRGEWKIPAGIVKNKCPGGPVRYRSFVGDRAASSVRRCTAYGTFQL